MLLLFSTILTLAFGQVARICDQGHLDHVQEICNARGRRLLQESDAAAINARDRMICACADLIPAEERNCYVHESASLTLQEEYDAHCLDLDAQQEKEEQVGVISSLFGSCSDPARAHCTDIESSDGCPSHWVTHKKEYRDGCGWLWRYPCDRCCEAGKNIVDENETSGRGGTCTCPDSYTYSVGTAANCVNGVVSDATESSDQKVTCRAFVKQIVATNEMITTGCGSGSTSCGFEYNLNQKLGLSYEYELENSLERNSDAEETSVGGVEASLGVSFSAGAETTVRAQIKGAVSYAWDGDDWHDLSELKLRMELNNMGFDMSSKIVIGLTGNLELSKKQKVKLGPQFVVGPQVINVPIGPVVLPIMVSMKVQPVANLEITGNVGASGEFTIENVYHESYSNMFMEFDLLNFATSENLDSITQTSAYSDMYTMLLAGEIGFELKAHVGVEVDFMLFETVGVQLTPAVSTKLSASGSAEYLKRWSTSTVVPPGQLTHECSATACIGGFVDAGLTWIGADEEQAIAVVKEKMGLNKLNRRQLGYKRPIRRNLGKDVTRRELASLNMAQQIRQTCQTEIQCTMGVFANMLSGVCDIDLSSLMDLDLSAPGSIEPPSMRIPIAEHCHTIGQQNGETYSRAGDANEVACTSGSALTCAGCRTQSNCASGDCEWKNGACAPSDPDYNMYPGAVCGKNFQAITTGWAACKAAAEELGYSGDTVAHVSSSVATSSRPQGCYIQGDDNNRVHYNRNNGIAHGNRFVGGDAIICIASAAMQGQQSIISCDAESWCSSSAAQWCQSWANNGECTNNPGYMHACCKAECGVCTASAEEALGGLSFSALNYPSENGPRNILLTGFAMIGVFSTIAYIYQKTFKGKYETIPYPSVEEI